MTRTEFRIPDTDVCRAAEETVRAHSPEALVNHCFRSYAFAAEYAVSRGVEHDGELLFVSAMLHDLGLEGPFDSTTWPFEAAGGQVAWVFAAGAGWPVERRDRAARAVVNHMRDVDAADDPEGHLLGVATSLDISGERPHLWDARFLGRVVSQYPRLDLASAFAERFASQALRKPGTAAAQSHSSGIAQRLTGNPLEHMVMAAEREGD